MTVEDLVPALLANNDILLKGNVHKCYIHSSLNLFQTIF